MCWRIRPPAARPISAAARRARAGSRPANMSARASARRSARRLVGEAAGLRVEADDLQPAVALLARDLALDGVAHAERHRHELADEAVAGVDAVQPRLARHDDVVLAPALEALVVRLAGDRVDLADRDLDRVRPPVRAAEAQPHRLALVHRQQHAAVLAPLRRHAVGVVGDAPHGKAAERRRQRVVATVVRDAQGALEADGEVAADLDAIGVDGDVKHGGAPFSLA